MACSPVTPKCGPVFMEICEDSEEPLTPNIAIVANLWNAFIYDEFPKYNCACKIKECMRAFSLHYRTHVKKTEYQGEIHEFVAGPLRNSYKYSKAETMAIMWEIYESKEDDVHVCFRGKIYDIRYD